jgi:hypothetical protein
MAERSDDDSSCRIVAVSNHRVNDQAGRYIDSNMAPGDEGVQENMAQVSTLYHKNRRFDLLQGMPPRLSDRAANRPMLT